MEHVLCWLWITVGKQLRHSRIKELLDIFGSIEKIYTQRSFGSIKALAPHEKEQLEDKDMSEAHRVLEETARLGAKIIVIDDENYPEILKNISDPPYVLYIQGRIAELDKVLTIGIVGTRRATENGIRITEWMSRGLAREGVVTISGLALGIDAASAWATLEEGGIAAAVLGNGLDVVYPQENAELYKELAQRGCIITEYPPGSPPIGKHFPVRNRIIAGLARGVLVTEAPMNSGALITANWALNNGRDVFAVPRDISERAILGTNMIIQQGAKLVNSPHDILCEYPSFKSVKHLDTDELPPHRLKLNDVAKQETVNKEAIFDGLDDREKPIVQLLMDGEMQVDEIARKLKAQVSAVSVLLTILEMKGKVKKRGTQYRLNI